MQDRIVEPLVLIIQHAENLLVNTNLSDTQRQFVQLIYDSAVQLRDIVITLSEITIERVKQVFSFESREQLTTIIGYAEVVLEEDAGDLSKDQRLALKEIAHAGRTLLQAIHAETRQ